MDKKIATRALALSVLMVSAAGMAPALAQTGGKARAAVAQQNQNLSFTPLAGEEGIVGLNYTIGEHGYPTISDIYKGGPADKSGLKSGDEIVGIDGEDTRFIGYLHFQPLLTGQSGSKVKLNVRGVDGSEKMHEIVRVNVETFKDSSLHNYDVARWSEAKAPAKPANHLIDLPFDMLSIEHNRPTLFEFSESATDSGVEALLKKHSDGTYILGQCKVVRITKDNPRYAPLRKYLNLQGNYALIPVYQPWLVTVKSSDVLRTPPNETQLNAIAKNLVHNSIRVQVSHAVAKEKGADGNGQKLNTKTGLAHRMVLKRFCQPLAKDEGIVGLGYAPDSEGWAEVTQVFKGGPADNAGLTSGATIVSVNGADTRFIGIERIQAELTGPIGHAVKIVYRPPGKGDGARGEKTVLLKYAPVKNFKNPGLNDIYVSTFKEVVATRPEDSDEFDVPCCMLALAKDKPTIFEIYNDVSAASAVKDLVQKLNASNKYSTQDVQVVRIGPDTIHYSGGDQLLKKYFHIQSDYACFPVYSRSHHKTIRGNEILTQVPKESDLELTFARLFPKDNKSARSEAHDHDDN